MKYLITNKTQKEWNGKKFVEATLISEGGGEYKVSAWDGQFDGVDEIDTELSKNEKGYWSLPKKQFKKMGALSLEEKRNKNIRENMDAKARDIAWFNSRNTALVFIEKYVCNPATSSPSEALEAVERYTDIFFKKWEEWNNVPF